MSLKLVGEIAFCEEHEEYDTECEQCMKDAERSALQAGIPLAVIRGEAKLTDFFTPEYIAKQCNRQTEGGDE